MMAELDSTPTAEVLEGLSDAIHSLAQPLTALSFVVDMALMQNSPEAWQTALVHARNESRRAIDALNEVRAAATALQPERELWELPH